MPPPSLKPIVRKLIQDVTLFAAHGGGLHLRSYQSAVARAVVDAVIQRRGGAFVVMFPRQSGKNETQAQIEAYLLARFSRQGGEIVKISPTWKPQGQNAMRRLERALRRNLLTQKIWVKESGYIYRVGAARITFLSGEPTANIVGATADLLLQVDEAQDIQPHKFDKDILPMAASTDAVRVFWGTAWTADTLLGRQLRTAKAASPSPGPGAPHRRWFVIDASVVAREVPAYGRFVAEQVRLMGRSHPLVRTQFYSQEIESGAGLFTPERIALMQGRHPPQESPRDGSFYAVLVDVGGESRSHTAVDAANAASAASRESDTGRDATALTVVEVDLSVLDDPANKDLPVVQNPVYRVVWRAQWVGRDHTLLYAEIKSICDHWRAVHVVVDATGVGAGLASFLQKALPARVIPYTFTQKSKSDLGWRFLSLVETGRYKDHTPQFPLSPLFWLQVAHCQGQVVPGPGRTLRWGVPDGARDPQTGALIHDDLLISAALAAVLDDQTWSRAESAVIAPLADRWNWDW